MKKLMYVFALAGAQILSTNALASSELDLGLSSDTVTLDYRFLDESRGSLWGAGLTRNDDLSATAVSAMFNVVGDTYATDQIHTGLGLKGVVHDTFQTAVSGAAGGFVRLEPAHWANVAFEGQLYFAPNMLNSNDARQYYEILARVTYDVHPRAKVFAGWINKTIKYDSDVPVRKVELNDNLNVGFILAF